MTNRKRHLQTIKVHRKYVKEACFKMGLCWQGLVHDLSKYSHKEMLIAKYADGKKSPHQISREKVGYSPSWLNHYHKNKHHWEYWLDDDENGKFYGIKMPYKYVIESVCDMLGASKAYNKDNWKPEMLWNYWETKCRGKRIMHPHSLYLTEKLLWNLYQDGEDEFYKWYKQAKDYLKENYELGEVDY